LAVWNWNDRNLHNEIKIPSFSASTEYPIKQIAFIGNTKNVAILSSLGQLIVVDVDAGVLLYKMKIKASIKYHSFAIILSLVI
jgi:hypothetical protein